MPVITLNYEDLVALTGADKDTILRRIPMMGCDIERIEEDHVDIEFFPNRPDLYSVEGVARAMRGFLGIETGLRRYSTTFSGITIGLNSEIKNIRPCIACAVVCGLNFDSRSIESLMALQEALHWAVGRNRKKVSIGVHDLSNIKPPFRYMAADPEFEFIPLDFTEKMSMRRILEVHPKGVRFAHILEPFDRYPLILDSEDTVLSFPPIINGTATRVTESTGELFIEVTGLDRQVNVALNIVATALAERGGSIETVRIADGSSDVITPDLGPASQVLPGSETAELLGFGPTCEEIAAVLEKMRYGAEPRGDDVFVEIPPYRADIMHPSDIIEDVAIGYGFENIPPELSKTATLGSSHPAELLKSRMREVMTGLGYMEVMPFTLTNERQHFELMQRQVSNEVTYVTHPISEDHTMLRTTLLPGLLEILSLNRHRELPQRIFEISDVVLERRNSLHLAAASVSAHANFAQIYAALGAVMRERRIGFDVADSSDPAFLAGRRADVLIGGESAGTFGELHPDVILNFGMDQPVVAFELRL